jgi:hypothetical protein
MIQGVREVFEIKDALRPAAETDIGPESREGKLVFIGRNISEVTFRKSFFSTVIKPNI